MTIKTFIRATKQLSVMPLNALMCAAIRQRESHIELDDLRKVIARQWQRAEGSGERREEKKVIFLCFAAVTSLELLDMIAGTSINEHGGKTKRNKIGETQKREKKMSLTCLQLRPAK
jgi:hypothetical protein